MSKVLAAVGAVPCSVTAAVSTVRFNCTKRSAALRLPIVRAELMENIQLWLRIVRGVGQLCRQHRQPQSGRSTPGYLVPPSGDRRPLPRLLREWSCGNTDACRIRAHWVGTAFFLSVVLLLVFFS